MVATATMEAAHLLVPTTEELNPYGLSWDALFENELQEEDNNADAAPPTWHPVPGLIHSKESVRLREAISTVLQDVCVGTSPEELELRATAPEYRLEEGDWATHDHFDNTTAVSHDTNDSLGGVTMAVIKTVARLPADLLVEDPSSNNAAAANHDAPAVRGWLKKRGVGNVALKSRFMQLEGNVIAYYGKEPSPKLSTADRVKHQKGLIELDKLTSLQPCGEKDLWWALELVTTNRIWVLQAESETEYMKWVTALCHTVSFQVINQQYRRMLCLQEVRATAKTDVRMNLPRTFTVQETVDHIFSCYEHALNAPPLKPYTKSDYVLKLTGFKDYLVDPSRLILDYQYVRECLLTKKTLRLSLVPKAAIHAMLSPHVRKSSSIGSMHGSKSSNRLSSIVAAMNASSRGGGVPVTSTSDDNNQQVLDDVDDGESDEAATAAASMAAMSLIAKSCNLNEPLRFCVHRALHVPNHTSQIKRTSHDVSIETTPLVYSNVVVRAQMFDGGEPLEDWAETVDTKLQPMAKTDQPTLHTAVWDQPTWFRSKMKVRDIPRSARLVVTMFGAKKDSAGRVSPDERECIGTTAVNLFDVDGLLVQGDTYVQLLSNVYKCVTGPVPHIVDPAKPYLQMAWKRFPTEVKFEVGEGVVDAAEVEDDDDPSSPKAIAIDKKGWLKKLGQQGTMSKWRDRWFSLDQAKATLSYAESPKSTSTKQIPLVGATVLIADQLNEAYTTYAVNKNTRRQVQTWGFKLKPANKSRIYLMSAETKQEREEWMAAIRAVAYEAIEFPNDNIEASLMTRPSGLVGSMFSTTSSVVSEAAEMSMTRPSDLSSDGLLDEIKLLMAQDPLVRLNKFQKHVLWTHRHLFIEQFEALPRILSCVNWVDPVETKEALHLMHQWEPSKHPAGYLMLLDAEFPNDQVRKFAVERLNEMADTTYSYFIPQLVQALKYENHHASALALQLIERGLRNPNQIGFDLFWAMKVEAENEQYRERYGTLLNTFLDVSSSKMREILHLQASLFGSTGKLEAICQYVKQLKATTRKVLDEIKGEMRKKLDELNETLPPSFQLPIDPRVEVGKLIVSKCKVMGSAKLPLWLVFENAEVGGDPVVVIFKSGDDVRQDSLTLQLIRVMDELWRAEGMDLAMEPYKCVATGPMTGLLQVVLNAVTTADIHKRVGNWGAFDDTSFSNWITANNQDKKSHRNAVDLFHRSCAGYCVATCVLGIGDRHNDNIMMTHGGRYFHIDFGHFLGHFKYQFGIKREKTPFVFTPEMAHVLGGRESAEFASFVNTCTEAFNIVRKHVYLMVTLFLLMIPADMPELRDRKDISHLVEVCLLNMSNEDAAKAFEAAIDFCLGNRFKRWDNYLHIIAHKYL
ncbi:Aste57867_8205 [Aphanomyces stellatus]|uniref:phosphatidylinositol 3-kinase n=1 Tax=Aphanomyces stellatus TaxID=120398 RepID=A0A485KJR0_9STRA|nr:hypothetical protein As57867_008174 [Aphanomyces stellatus]VFT85092.1 Aste57867_8205 [Aphanomyces stellatus]